MMEKLNYKNKNIDWKYSKGENNILELDFID